MRQTLLTAFAGLALGAVAVPLFTFGPAFLVFAALIGLAALRRDSRALGGGFLIAFGLWWLYFTRDAVERCAAFNRQPGGSCAISGTEEQVVFAGCVAVVGVLLIALALRERRSRRA